MADDIEKRVRQALRNHLKMGDSKREAIVNTAESFEDVSFDWIEDVANEIYAGGKRKPEMMEGIAGVSEDEMEERANEAHQRSQEREENLEEMNEEQREEERQRAKESSTESETPGDFIQNMANVAEKERKIIEEKKPSQVAREQEKAEMASLDKEMEPLLESDNISEEDKEYFREMKQNRLETLRERKRSAKEYDEETDIEKRTKEHEKKRESDELYPDEEPSTGEEEPGMVCPECQHKPPHVKYDSNSGMFICMDCGHKWNPRPDEERDSGGIPGAAFLNTHGIIFAVILSVLSSLPMFVFNFSLAWFFTWLGITLLGMERMFR